MKIRTYILVGSLSAGLFALSSLPAHLLWRVAGPQVSSFIPFSVESVGGSVWDGYVVGRPQGPVTDRMVVSWDLKPGSLLMGRLAVGLGLEGAQFKASGTGYAGLAGKGIYDFSAEADASMLDSYLQGMGASASGKVSMDSVAVGFNNDFQVVDAAGTVNWKGGTVQASFGEGQESYTVPAVTGVLSQRSNGAFLDVKQLEGGRALGEVGITGDGLLSVTVLQRVMTLVGMQASDENKILIKTQQPLF